LVLGFIKNIRSGRHQVPPILHVCRGESIRVVNIRQEDADFNNMLNTRPGLLQDLLQGPHDLVLLRVSKMMVEWTLALTKRSTMFPSTIFLVRGSAPRMPEVKTKPLAMMAGVYTPGRRTGASSAKTPTLGGDMMDDGVMELKGRFRKDDRRG
jgi:hypothetical protein